MVGIYEPHTKQNLPYVRMVNNYAAGLSQKVTIIGTPNHDSCEKMQISFVYYRVRSYIKELLQIEARFREQKLLITHHSTGEEKLAESPFPFKPGKDFKMEILLDRQNPLVIKVDGAEVKHAYGKKHIDDYLHLVTVNGEVKLHEFHVDPEPARQVMEHGSRVVVTPPNANAFLSYWDGHRGYYQSGYFHYLSGFTSNKRIVMDVSMADRLPSYVIELVSMENRIGPGFKLFRPFVLLIEFEKRKVYLCSRAEPEETDNNMFDCLSERFQVLEVKKPFPFFYEQRMTLELVSGDHSSVEVNVNGSQLGRLDVPTFDLSLVNMLVVGYYFKMYSLAIKPEVDQFFLSGGIGEKAGGGVVLESEGKIGRIWKTPYTYTNIGGFVPPKWFRIFGKVPRNGYFHVQFLDGAGNLVFSFSINVDPPDWKDPAGNKYVSHCYWAGHSVTETVATGDAVAIPFAVGRPFTLDFTAGNKEIHVDVNGKRFYSTTGWKEDDLKKINTLKILHTVTLFGVYSERTGILKLPYECDLFGFLSPTHFRIFGSTPKEGVFFVRLYDDKAGEDKEKWIMSFAVNLQADKKWIDRHWLGKPDYKEKIAEGDKVPFSVGRPFMLDIVAGNEQIIFNVDGEKFNTVATISADMKTISKLRVYENIQLHSVELNVPYTADIKDGFVKAGKKIRCVIVPLNQGDTRSRFDMFDSNNDILFHFGLRPDVKKCARNTFKKVDGWLSEEDSGGFPFVLEKQHTLEFVAQKEKIEIHVDGKKEYEFKARDDLSAVKKFEVSGELILQSVNVLEK